MNKESLENSIISTLIYYDVLGGYPLTAFEIYKFLINNTCNFDDLLKILDNNKKIKKIINNKNGFYFLRKNSDLIVKRRIERQKLAVQKWEKTRKIIKWLQILPYVKAVGVSGSLSINNTKKESDLDLFIIAKYGRIWTVRAFVNSFLELIRQKRHDLVIKDKICPNWFITDKSLKLKLKNLSRAHFCEQLIPIFGLSEFDKFFKANKWVKQYLSSYNSINKKNNIKIIKTNKFFKYIAKLLEYFLNTKIGDFIEKKFKNWQKNKIIKNVKPEYLSFNQDNMAKNTQAHLCLSDKALVLHYPVSRNLELEKKYNKLCISCV